MNHLLLSKTLLNKTPQFTLFIICLIVLVLAIKMGLANVYSYGLSSWHQRWRLDYASTLTADNISVADSVMQGMLDKDVTHPFYLTLAAKQLEWRNFFLQLNKRKPSVDDAVDFKKIEQFYLRAAKQRPTWPNTYADLAKHSWQHGQDTDNVMLYLKLAKAAAPYAETTVLAFIQLGLKQWSLLEQKQRADVARYTILAMQTPALRHKALKLFKDPAIQLRACNLLAFVKLKPKVCKA